MLRKKQLFLILSILAIFSTVVILLLMGRQAICQCGYIKLWHGNPQSSENSQHLTDFYTFSHIIHGFFFYWLFWRYGRKMPVIGWLFMSILPEALWEILENTDFIINRYREGTISLDYYGDSIINSVFDILAMVLGFFIAFRFPVITTVLLAVAMELIVGLLIRDNLTLNIIMLFYPIEAILRWQKGV